MEGGIGAQLHHQFQPVVGPGPFGGQFRLEAWSGPMFTSLSHSDSKTIRPTKVRACAGVQRVGVFLQADAQVGGRTARLPVPKISENCRSVGNRPSAGMS
jgi:hypothetical protein